MFKNAKDETDEKLAQTEVFLAYQTGYSLCCKKKKKSHTLNEELQGLSAIVDYIAAEEASSISFSKMISWFRTMRSYLIMVYMNGNKMDLI